MRWKWVLGAIALVVVGFFAVAYIMIATYDFNKLKPRIAGAVRDATGRELTLAGDFKLSFGLSPTVSLEGVSLQNAPWGSRPEMARIKRFEIQMALLPLFRREIQFKRLILVEPDILIEKDPSGKSNLDFKPVAKPKAEEGPGRAGLPPVVVEEIRIEKGIATIRDAKKAKSSSLAITELKAAVPAGEKPIEFDLKGSYDGKPLEVRGSAGPAHVLMDQEKPSPVNLTAQAAGATLKVEGTIKELLKAKGLDLTVSAEGPSFRNIAEFGGVAGMPDLGAFKLNTKIRGDTEKLTLTNLKAAAGSSDISGSAELTLSGKVPRITADLSSQKLDLEPFSPKKEQKPSPSGKPAPGAAKVFSSEPLPLEKLKTADAQIRMQAATLLVRGLTLTNFFTDLNLEAGNLAIKQLRFLLSGGEIDGQLTIRSQERGASFGVYLNARQIAVGPLLKRGENKEIVGGKLDAEIKVSGQGRSIAEWMAGLNGRTFANLSQGRIHNKYLSLWGEDLSKSLTRLVHPSQKGDDSTAINCFVNGFDIKNGLATCSALALDTDQMSIVGAGDVDLRNETLNLFFQPSPKKAILPESVGQASLSLGELTKPFKLSGTLAHPSLGIDVSQTLTTLGRAFQGWAKSGPAGVLGALQAAPSQDKNPCLTAIEAAKKGVPQGRKTQEQKVPADVLEGLGKGLQELFKR